MHFVLKKYGKEKLFVLLLYALFPHSLHHILHFIRPTIYTKSTAVFSTDNTDIFQVEWKCAKPCTSLMKKQETRDAPTASLQ